MKAIAIILSLSLCAAVSAAAVVSPDLKSQWRKTIRYGTDAQILEIVEKLRDAKDASFTDELARVLDRTPNVSVQKAVLDLFAEQKAKEGQAAARALLSDWRNKPADPLISAMRFLVAIEAAGIAKNLLPLIDSPDNGVAFEALGSIGKSGDRTATKGLLERLASPDFAEARRARLILALGELKDPAAVDALLAILNAKEVEKANRLYAADALGKIGDPKAIPALKDLLKENDALLRAYAASALTRFDVSLVIAELHQGLRDDNWRVRIECAKALAKPLPPDVAGEAVEILSYKAEFDPVVQVRLEAIAALGKIGNEESSIFLMGMYSNRRNPLESRERALMSLAAKNLSVLEVDGIKAVVTADRVENDQRALLSQAKALSVVKASGLDQVFRIFLDCPDVSTKLQAIKGIELNDCGDLVQKLLELSEKDPNAAMRREAKRVAEKLSGSRDAKEGKGR